MTYYITMQINSEMGYKKGIKSAMVKVNSQAYLFFLLNFFRTVFYLNKL